MWICGAKVKPGKRVYIDEFCGYEQDCGDHSQNNYYTPSNEGGYYPPPPAYYQSSDHSSDGSASSPRGDYGGSDDGHYSYPPPAQYHSSGGHESSDRSPRDIYDGQSGGWLDQHPATRWEGSVDLAAMFHEAGRNSGDLAVEQRSAGRRDWFLGQQQACSEFYVVPWRLTILPGYLARIQGKSDSREWPPIAESHFYESTNKLVKEVAVLYMGSGVQSSSETLRLVRVEHSKGRISGSGCSSGLRKLAHYEFLFKSEADADYFRDWIRPNNSRAAVDTLKRLDPDGICGATGDTGMMQRKRYCLRA